MAKITLKALTDARNSYDECITNLKQRFKDNILWIEDTGTGGKRRPVFIVRNQSELDDVKSTVQSLERQAAEIRGLAGSDVRLAMPAVEEGVLLYRIWVNQAHASSTTNTSRAEIIDRIKRRIDTVQRYENETNALILKQLDKELEFFQNETEEFYRARSKGHPVTTVGLSKIHGIDGKVKVSDAGLFIVGADFQTPRGEIPDNEKTKKRKPRINIFDGLTPVEYSGAANALLYRESEVEARKAALNFTDTKQDAVKKANKSSKTRRKAAK